MKKRIGRGLAGAALAALVAGCSAIEGVPPADGSDEYVLACEDGSALDECARRAAAACPAGYRTLDAEQGFERAEFRIRCLQGE